jgi:hypothetical protein
MNIKRLLVGLVGAFVSVCGASAGDAVVAEPETAQYMRVCDAYGAGYFYIPGTETCLKVSGYVRYDIGFGALKGVDTDGVDGGDAFNKSARFALKTDTAAETDYGTLHTYAEFRFNYGSKGFVRGNNGADRVAGTADDVAPIPASADNRPLALGAAYIELGGLRIGRDESVYKALISASGGVINEDQINFGPLDTTLISYTFSSRNFSAVVSLEDDAGAGKGYIPDVVLGVQYKAGNFRVSGVLGYDESLREIGGKVRLDADLGDVSLFLTGGYGTDKNFTTSRYKPWGGNWAVWSGASVKVSDKADASVQLVYNQTKSFGAAANIVYEIVPGFKTIAEINYAHKAAAKGEFGGALRFQRSF